MRAQVKGEKMKKLDTICVQGGYKPKSGEPRVVPIVQSTTYYYEKAGEMADLFDLKSEGYFYTRLANPTVDAFENIFPLDIRVYHNYNCLVIRIFTNKYWHGCLSC